MCLWSLYASIAECKMRSAGFLVTLLLVTVTRIDHVQADVYSDSEIDRQAAQVKCDEINPCYLCEPYRCQKCKPGFIRRADKCFPERNISETCFFSFQCTIFPMVCDDGVDKDGLKHCACGKFFSWSNDLGECVDVDKEYASAVAAEYKEKMNVGDRIRMDAERIFPGTITAGVLAVSMLSIIALAGAAYICYPRIRNSSYEGVELQDVQPNDKKSDAVAVSPECLDVAGIC